MTEAITHICTAAVIITVIICGAWILIKGME